MHSVPPIAPAPANGDALPRITVAGLPIVACGREALCAQMVADVARARAGALTQPRIVTSANGAVISLYHRDAHFAAVLNNADIIDADGMSLVFASRLRCRQPLPERAATTDFLLDASEMAAREGVRFFFLGAQRGVAARAAEHLRSRFPGLEVVGTCHGYFTEAQLPRLCEAILARRTDVLWLGIGTPAQEELAPRLRAMLPGVAWIRTSGGLFDHYGGGVSRAPRWMQALGGEWLYRAAREPVRLGWRYLATSPPALYHLLTKTHD